MKHETDPILRRFERNLVIAAVVMTGVAAVAGRLDVAAGVVGGALLMGIGYGGIKAAVDLITAASSQNAEAAASRSGRRRRTWTIVKFVSRYALLVLAAYVMLVRLHVHPLGLMLGASAPVISAAIEGVSIARRLSRPGDTR